jgi:hypothetical protein
MRARISANIRPFRAPRRHPHAGWNVEKPPSSLKTFTPGTGRTQAPTQGSPSPPPPISLPTHKILPADAADCNFLLILAKHLGISLWIRLQQGNRIALQLKIKEQLNVPDSRNRKAS